MSITSEELNYLIWRYLQETGNELSALALQEETRVLEFEKNYKENIPVGTLVNFVQRGILYTESELLVHPNGKVKPIDENHFSENFNLVQALQIDKEKYPALVSKGRFELEKLGREDSNELESTESAGVSADHTESDVRMDQDHDEEEVFAKTLNEIFKLGKAVCLQWNPVSSNILAIGEHDSTAKLIELETTTTDDQIKLIEKTTHELRHPFATSATTGKITNQLTCLSWAHDGDSIATGVENGELRLWNKEGKLQNVFNFHKSPIIAIHWNSSNTHFISTDADNITILWDVNSGVVLQHFESKANQINGNNNNNSNQMFGVDTVWVDTDKFVIPGPGGNLLVYTMSDSRPIGKLVGHRGTISQLEFNSETKLLASAADDNTIRVWHGGNGNSIHCFYGHTQTIVSLKWVNNDMLISASMDGSVKLWDCGKKLQEITGNLIAETIVDGVPIFAGAISDDRERYAAGFMDGQVTVFNLAALLKRYSKGKKHKNHVMSIPICGDFQSAHSDDSVFDLSWKEDRLAIAYSINEGAIVQ